MVSKFSNSGWTSSNDGKLSVCTQACVCIWEILKTVYKPTYYGARENSIPWVELQTLGKILRCFTVFQSFQVLYNTDNTSCNLALRSVLGEECSGLTSLPADAQHDIKKTLPVYCWGLSVDCWSKFVAATKSAETYGPPILKLTSAIYYSIFQFGRFTTTKT